MADVPSMEELSKLMDNNATWCGEYAGDSFSVWISNLQMKLIQSIFAANRGEPVNTSLIQEISAICNQNVPSMEHAAQLRVLKNLVLLATSQHHQHATAEAVRGDNHPMPQSNASLNLRTTPIRVKTEQSNGQEVNEIPPPPKNTGVKNSVEVKREQFAAPVQGNNGNLLEVNRPETDARSEEEFRGGKSAPEKKSDAVPSGVGVRGRKTGTVVFTRTIVRKINDGESKDAIKNDLIARKTLPTVQKRAAEDTLLPQASAAKMIKVASDVPKREIKADIPETVALENVKDGEEATNLKQKEDEEKDAVGGQKQSEEKSNAGDNSSLKQTLMMVAYELKDRSFKCPYCNESVPTGGFDLHIQTYHRHERLALFECTECAAWYCTIKGSVPHRREHGCKLSIRSVADAEKAKKEDPMNYAKKPGWVRRSINANDATSSPGPSRPALVNSPCATSSNLDKDSK